jgi:hypothetical protein
MTLRFESARASASGRNVAVFVSASIPDPNRWEGDADPLEITDAVVSLARAFLTEGVRLVTAAHPTIAPLLEYVAAELPAEHGERIVIYQSRLFADVLPEATRRFQEDGIGRVIWTDAVPGDRPEPEEWHPSLDVMRRQMLNETYPIAAVFIGGMAGIPLELKLFNELRPGQPTYPIGRPGGEARALARESDSPLREQLINGEIYPALWRAVLSDLAAGGHI